MTSRPAYLLATSCLLTTSLGCGFTNGDVRGGGLYDGSAARIESTPEELVFARRGSSDSRTATLVLENTGRSTLDIMSIQLVEEPGDGLDELTPEGFWPSKFMLEPGDTLSLTVRWTPGNDVTDTGSILIHNNDAAKRNFEIPVVTPRL